jgi:probable rRNA maturation factor
MRPACPAYEVAVSGRGLDRRQRGAIAAAVRATLRRESCATATVSVAIVDDTTMAGLHARYMGIAGPTDVMSFDLGGQGAAEVDGEVVVSGDTARREAKRRRIPTEPELLRYVIHGTLHLLGYLDDRPERAKRMHRIEDEVLREEERRRGEATKRRSDEGKSDRRQVGASSRRRGGTRE